MDITYITWTKTTHRRDVRFYLFLLLQVVLKALDPIFDIEDPYAPNIQGLNSFHSLLDRFNW